jgi:hypothetical protein
MQKIYLLQGHFTCPIYLKGDNMKKIIVLIIICLCSFTKGATLIQYDMAAAAPSTEAAGVESNDSANGQSLPTWEVPSNQSYASDPVLYLAPLNGATDAASAVSGGSYFEITITPAEGKKFTLTDLDFNAARGGAATPRGWVLRSSIDSYAGNIDTSDIATQRTTWTAFNVDLTGGSFDNLEAAVTFRIYVYAPTTASSIEFDDITFSGTVEDISSAESSGSQVIFIN